MLGVANGVAEILRGVAMATPGPPLAPPLSTGGSSQLHIADEWSNVKVTAYGANRAAQLQSLRKKIHKHRMSDYHQAAEKTTKNKNKFFINHKYKLLIKNRYSQRFSQPFHSSEV